MKTSWIQESGVAWNPIELVPTAQLERIQVAKLRNQLQYLLDRSPFYQEKLKDAPRPDQVNSLADLAKFPFTDKDELRASLEAVKGLGLHGAADVKDLIQVQASSGTTGRPSYVGLTQRDSYVWSEMTARTFYAVGIRPGDVCLHAYSMSKGFVGGLPMVQAEQYFGMISLPIGAEAGIERLLTVIADQRPTVILGTPNFLIFLAQQAPAVLGVPASELGVKILFTGGEPGAGIPAVRQRMEELWGGARAAEMFGGTDGGLAYWSECEVGDGMHFIAPDFLIPEIVEPGTDAVLAPETGVEGEIVYTMIQRDASPLLRFRSKDWISVTGTECSCGRTGYKVRCTGRLDDMLIVRGFNVFPAAIKDLVADAQPLTSGEFRIIVDFEGHTTQKALRLQVERGEGQTPDGDASMVEGLMRVLSSRLGAKFAIEVVDYETFERPGTAKVNLIIREPAAAGATR